MKKLIKDKVLLIVDDEIDFARVLSWDFGDYGMQVHLSNGATQAIELLSNTRIDFILSDIEMPLGSGVELIEHINTNKVKVLGFYFMTGFTDRDEDELISLGVEKLFKKPINTEKVIFEFIEILKSKL